MLAFAALLVVLIAFLKKYLQKINPYLLFLVFSLMYVGMSVYLIVNVDPTIRADAATVFNTAKKFAQGDFSAFFKSGYIERYPQQAGLVLYDSLLQKISESPAVSFSANAVFVLGINFFILKIALFLSKERVAALLTVLLSFAFLPQFFFILFAYGLIPGFFFMILAFYHAIRFSHKHKIHNAIIAVVSISIAICLKQNYLIGMIAIALWWLLDLFKSRGWGLLRPALAILALLICFSVPSKLVLSYYEHKTEGDLSGGTPTVLWIVMGTDLDNRQRAPGWYNSFNYSTYTKSGYDPERAAEIGRAKLENNLEKMKADPKKTLSFFKDKTISQWCDPMFQSVWTGPLEACKQSTHTPLLQSIYSGGDAEKQIARLSKYVVILTFGFTLACLILRRKERNGRELLLMFFIGGLLFQTFWEGKSQYTYPYVFILIPIAAIGILTVAERIKEAYDRRRASKHVSVSDSAEVSAPLNEVEM